MADKNGKNMESAEPTAGISGSLTRKGIRDELSRQVGFVWVCFGFLGVFCVHFRSTFGFGMALSKLILGFIGFRLGFFVIFGSFSF